MGEALSSLRQPVMERSVIASPNSTEAFIERPYASTSCTGSDRPPRVSYTSSSIGVPEM